MSNCPTGAASTRESMCASGSTSVPHGHWCGSHNLEPRRKPTATRTALSSRCKPQADISSACNQSPLGRAVTATRCAWLRLSGRHVSIRQTSTAMYGSSHSHCFSAASPTGRVTVVLMYISDQYARTSSSAESTGKLHRSKILA